MDHSLCKDCKGFCCDDIGLPFTPQELKNSYHRWIGYHHSKQSVKTQMSNSDEKATPIWEDIHLAYPMLVFTHKDSIHPDGDVKKKIDVYHYKCLQHDSDGNCRIYEERPMMCRTFPDGGFCGYRDVTIKEVIDDRPDWFEFGMTDEERGRVKFGLPKNKPHDESPTEVKAEETE